MNRNIVVLGLVLCLVTIEYFAVDFMGPPTAGLKKGQWDVGFNYMHSEGDITVENIGNVTILGVSVPAPAWLGAVKIPLNDAKSNRYYAKFGYGLEDWWEIDFSLGGGSLDASNSEFDIDFSGSTNFAAALGTKITFAEEDNLSWGCLFQVSWLNSEDSSSDIVDLSGFGLGAAETVKIDTDIDLTEIQIAIGPTLKMEGWSLYGGGFFYFLDGDGDMDVEVVGVGKGSASGDLDHDSIFGGYIGSQFEVAENTLLTVEYSFTGEGWGIGTGITWKF